MIQSFLVKLEVKAVKAWQIRLRELCGIFKEYCVWTELIIGEELVVTDAGGLEVVSAGLVAATSSTLSIDNQRWACSDVTLGGIITTVGVLELAAGDVPLIQYSSQKNHYIQHQHLRIVDSPS